MAKIDLIDNGWVDLVFEGKNQAYGAYQMRKNTGVRNLKALIVMFVAFALIAAIVYAKVSIENYIASQNAAIEADVELASLAEKKEAKVEKKDEPEPEKVEESKVFDVVEEMPQFPGGPSALFEYLSKNIKYPVVAEENGVQGRVIVTFVVERDGSITDVKVVKSVDPSLDKEATRVVKSMPHWIPGKQNGSAVRVKYTVPVTFRLQ